jgi:hypothetical protein
LRYYIEYLRLVSLQHVVEVLEEKNESLLKESNEVKITNTHLINDLAYQQENKLYYENSLDELREINQQYETTIRQLELTIEQDNYHSQQQENNIADIHTSYQEQVAKLEKDLENYREIKEEAIMSKLTCQEILKLSIQKDSQIASLNELIEKNSNQFYETGLEKEQLQEKIQELEEQRFAKFLEENQFKDQILNQKEAISNLNNRIDEITEEKDSLVQLNNSLQEEKKNLLENEIPGLKGERHSLQKLLKDIMIQLQEKETLLEEEIQGSSQKQLKIDSLSAELQQKNNYIQEFVVNEQVYQENIQSLQEVITELLPTLENSMMKNEDFYERMRVSHTLAEKKKEYAKFLEEELFQARHYNELYQGNQRTQFQQLQEFLFDEAFEEQQQQQVLPPGSAGYDNEPFEADEEPIEEIVTRPTTTHAVIFNQKQDSFRIAPSEGSSKKENFASSKEQQKQQPYVIKGMSSINTMIDDLISEASDRIEKIIQSKHGSEQASVNNASLQDQDQWPQQQSRKTVYNALRGNYRKKSLFATSTLNPARNQPTEVNPVEERLLLLMRSLDEKMTSMDQMANNLKILVEKADLIEGKPSQQAKEGKLAHAVSEITLVSFQPDQNNNNNNNNRKSPDELSYEEKNTTEKPSAVVSLMGQSSHLNQGGGSLISTGSKNQVIEDQVNLEKLLMEMKNGLDEIKQEFAFQTDSIKQLTDLKKKLKFELILINQQINNLEQLPQQTPESTENFLAYEQAKVETLQQIKNIKNQLVFLKQNQIVLNSKSVELQSEMFHIHNEICNNAQEFHDVYQENITKYYPEEILPFTFVNVPPSRKFMRLTQQSELSSPEGSLMMETDENDMFPENSLANIKRVGVDTSIDYTNNNPAPGITSLLPRDVLAALNENEEQRETNEAFTSAAQSNYRNETSQGGNNNISPTNITVTSNDEFDGDSSVVSRPSINSGGETKKKKKKPASLKKEKSTRKSRKSMLLTSNNEEETPQQPPGSSNTDEVPNSADFMHQEQQQPQFPVLESNSLLTTSVGTPKGPRPTLVIQETSLDTAHPTIIENYPGTALSSNNSRPVTNEAISSSRPYSTAFTNESYPGTLPTTALPLDTSRPVSNQFPSRPVTSTAPPSRPQTQPTSNQIATTAAAVAQTEQPVHVSFIHENPQAMPSRPVRENISHVVHEHTPSKHNIQSIEVEQTPQQQPQQQQSTSPTNFPASQPSPRSFYQPQFNTKKGLKSETFQKKFEIQQKQQHLRSDYISRKNDLDSLNTFIYSKIDEIFILLETLTDVIYDIIAWKESFYDLCGYYPNLNEAQRSKVYHNLYQAFHETKQQLHLIFENYQQLTDRNNELLKEVVRLQEELLTLQQQLLSSTSSSFSGQNNMIEREDLPMKYSFPLLENLIQEFQQQHPQLPMYQFLGGRAHGSFFEGGNPTTEEQEAVSLLDSLILQPLPASVVNAMELENNSLQGMDGRMIGMQGGEEEAEAVMRFIGGGAGMDYSSLLTEGNSFVHNKLPVASSLEDEERGNLVLEESRGFSRHGNPRNTVAVPTPNASSHHPLFKQQQQQQQHHKEDHHKDNDHHQHQEQHHQQHHQHITEEIAKEKLKVQEMERVIHYERKVSVQAQNFLQDTLFQIKENDHHHLQHNNRTTLISNDEKSPSKHHHESSSTAKEDHHHHQQQHHQHITEEIAKEKLKVQEMERVIHHERKVSVQAQNFLQDTLFQINHRRQSVAIEQKKEYDQKTRRLSTLHANNFVSQMFSGLDNVVVPVIAKIEQKKEYDQKTRRLSNLHANTFVSQMFSGLGAVGVPTTTATTAAVQPAADSLKNNVNRMTTIRSKESSLAENHVEEQKSESKGKDDDEVEPVILTRSDALHHHFTEEEKLLKPVEAPHEEPAEEKAVIESLDDHLDDVKPTISVLDVDEEMADLLFSPPGEQINENEWDSESLKAGNQLEEESVEDIVSKYLREQRKQIALGEVIPANNGLDFYSQDSFEKVTTGENNNDDGSFIVFDNGNAVTVGDNNSMSNITNPSEEKSKEDSLLVVLEQALNVDRIATPEKAVPSMAADLGRPLTSRGSGDQRRQSSQPQQPTTEPSLTLEKNDHKIAGSSNNSNTTSINSKQSVVRKTVVTGDELEENSVSSVTSSKSRNTKIGKEPKAKSSQDKPKIRSTTVEKKSATKSTSGERKTVASPAHAPIVTKSPVAKKEPEKTVLKEEEQEQEQEYGEEAFDVELDNEILKKDTKKSKPVIESTEDKRKKSVSVSLEAMERLQDSPDELLTEVTQPITNRATLVAQIEKDFATTGNNTNTSTLAPAALTASTKASVKPAQKPNPGMVYSNNAQVQAMMVEFQQLKYELKIWTDGFYQQNQREPNIQDFNALSSDLKTKIARKNQLKKLLNNNKAQLIAPFVSE